MHMERDGGRQRLVGSRKYIEICRAVVTDLHIFFFFSGITVSLKDTEGTDEEKTVRATTQFSWVRSIFSHGNQNAIVCF